MLVPAAILSAASRLLENNVCVVPQSGTSMLLSMHVVCKSLFGISIYTQMMWEVWNVSAKYLWYYTLNSSVNCRFLDKDCSAVHRTFCIGFSHGTFYTSPEIGRCLWNTWSFSAISVPCGCYAVALIGISTFLSPFSGLYILRKSKSSSKSV